MKEQQNGCLIGVIVAIVAAVILLLFPVGCYNSIVSSDEAIDAAWAQVETVLQRRYDLIPNLVNTVKGFADQEKAVLTEVTALRSQWAKAGTVAEKARAATGLEAALGRLMVISERYPELKSNQNFLRLQDELAGTENRVSVERRRYNETVRRYNVTVRKLPGKIVANIAGFEERDVYFEAASGAETAPVVEF